MQNWKKIWENKSLTDVDSNDNVLMTLMKLDGFDSGFNSLTEEIWTDYVSYIKNRLNINNGQSVYEIGCGSGAFLYPFYINNHKIGGLDYSASLIDSAKHFMPNASFTVSEAIDLSTDEKYDFVVSNGVFLYFTTYKYAKVVLSKMLEKANYSVAVLEVSDYEKKEEALFIRKKHMSEEEYQKRYKGLDHLYYKKSWFLKLADELNCNIEIEDQRIKDYPNNAYRFNVFFYKR